MVTCIIIVLYTCTQVLKTKDLKVVYEFLADARNRWYNIGLQLDIEPEILDTIRNSNDDALDCLREMLKEYLKQVTLPPTWQRIVTALQAKTVGYAHLAQEIEQKCCSESTTHSRKRHHSGKNS